MTSSTFLLLAVIALVLFGTNVYISCRLYQGFHAVYQNLNMLRFGIFYAVLAALAILSVMRCRLPLSPAVKYALGPSVRNAFGLFGGYWMGAYVYLLLTLLCADLLLLGLGALKLIPLPVTGTARFVSGLAAILATAVILTAGTIHAGNFAHRSYEVSTGTHSLPPSS